MLRAVPTVIIILMFIGDREHVCVASGSIRIFPRDQSVHLLQWKIQITRCEKSRFYLVLAKIWIKKSG